MLLFTFFLSSFTRSSIITLFLPSGVISIAFFTLALFRFPHLVLLTPNMFFLAGGPFRDNSDWYTSHRCDNDGPGRWFPMTSDLHRIRRLCNLDPCSSHEPSRVHHRSTHIEQLHQVAHSYLLLQISQTISCNVSVTCSLVSPSLVVNVVLFMATEVGVVL